MITTQRQLLQQYITEALLAEVPKKKKKAAKKGKAATTKKPSPAQLEQQVVSALAGWYKVKDRMKERGSRKVWLNAREGKANFNPEYVAHALRSAGFKAEGNYDDTYEVSFSGPGFRVVVPTDAGRMDVGADVFIEVYPTKPFADDESGSTGIPTWAY